MSVLAIILKFLVHGAPLAAIPVALIWGVKPVVYALVLIAFAMLAGPYLYFGGQAMMMGMPVLETLEVVRQSGIGMVLLAEYVVAWALAYACGAAAVRFAWFRWRAA